MKEVNEDNALLALAKKEIPHLPVIPLTNHEILWLGEVWHYLLGTGNLPSYMKIRTETLEKTGPDFNPYLIDRKLLKQEAIEITLLGILHIERDRLVLDDIDKLLLAIQKILRKNYEQKELDIHLIADELGLGRAYARILFMTAVPFGLLWRSAGTSADGKPYGYERFSIEAANFDFYMRFKGIRACMEEYFAKEAMSVENDSRISPRSRRIRKSTMSGFLPYAPYAPPTSTFINEERISELEQLTGGNFDLSKLIRLCDEINMCYSTECYYAIPALIRMIIDHVPPIFDKSKFAEIATQYGNRNFQRAMAHLDNTSRTVANEIMHTQISDREILINENSVNFSQDIDYLLGEIIYILHPKAGKSI